MGASFQTFPVSAVFDRSFNGKITVTAIGNGGAITETGASLWRDGDYTTAYEATNTSPDLVDNGESVVIDFGKIYSNVQIAYKVVYNSGAQNAQYTFEYSTDGTNYTAIETGAGTGGATITKTASKAYTQIRYIRANLHLGGQVGTAFSIKLYEVRLAGSA